MTDSASADDRLDHHLERLAVDADDIAAFLTAEHDPEGDIRPEALGKAEGLATSLREVIHALTHHEHLAMKADDVWRAISRRHQGKDDGTVN